MEKILPKIKNLQTESQIKARSGRWGRDNAYDELMGAPFSKTPKLAVIEHPDFWALAELRGDEFHIRISTGVVAAISNLWADALTNETLCKDGINAKAKLTPQCMMPARKAASWISKSKACWIGLSPPQTAQ